jgi:hypothetical protein
VLIVVHYMRAEVSERPLVSGQLCWQSFLAFAACALLTVFFTCAKSYLRKRVGSCDEW